MNIARQTTRRALAAGVWAEKLKTVYKGYYVVAQRLTGLKKK
jgi:hypothetical protein